MKGKVYVVSKTHLDLGYTDLAENVLKRYVEEFIPKAVKIAADVNADGKKFVWTLGAWIIDRALRDDNAERVASLEAACARGDIVPHAMPFTVQSELMDERLADDALDVVHSLDGRFGRKTIAAKMTDVPGHTIGIVPVLARHGIKLLHIGVNKSSAVPQVPRCFVWKYGEAEVIVIYEGSYGRTFSHPLIDDVLVFDHSMDNNGPYSAEKTLRNFGNIVRKYPDKEVVAGTLDDFAEKLWAVKDRLPVVTSEIGDTWIHGVSADPYKYSALRTLCRLRERWIAEGNFLSGELYDEFASDLLCLAEHTCGMGVLKGFRDYDNYLRPHFLEARNADCKIRRFGIFRLPFVRRAYAAKRKKGAYSLMERSWEEQRGYIDHAVSLLPDELRREAERELAALRPTQPPSPTGKPLGAAETVSFDGWEIRLNKFGAPEKLCCGGRVLIDGNARSLLDFHSVAPAEFSFWLRHYQRDLIKTFTWAIPDFARPKLRRISRRYSKGTFPYAMSEARVDRAKKTITVFLDADSTATHGLGAPLRAAVEYAFDGDSVAINALWTDKPASRLPEEIILHLPLRAENRPRYVKLGATVNALDIVPDGSRNLNVTQSFVFRAGEDDFVLEDMNGMPLSPDGGKLLRFDNVFGDFADGVSYYLYNNVWGTNYPLWYGDNARFSFVLRKAGGGRADKENDK